MKQANISKLRRLAKTLDDDPDRRDPHEPGRRAGLEMIEAGLAVYLDADNALQRAVDFGGRGYAGGGTQEGRGKGGHSSPVESAAFKPDGFSHAGAELKSALKIVRGWSATVARQVDRLMSTAPPATEAEEARCAEYATGGCEELAVKDRRCAADYQWLRNHPGESHVPREVIDERRHGKALAS